MRQKIIKVDVSEGSSEQDVGGVRPEKVWLWSSRQRPEDDAIPVHNANARLEDLGHDWRWLGKGRFRYCGVGHGDAEYVWLILQYDLDAHDSECGNCGQDLPDNARFCDQCGTRQKSF